MRLNAWLLQSLQHSFSFAWLKIKSICSFVYQSWAAIPPAHSQSRRVLSVSLSRQENLCGWDAKNNKCAFMPWGTRARRGHGLAFKGLRRLCPWWHAIYDLVNPFLIILLWQRWKYPTSNDWLYWYAAICASVEEQSHKSNKLEKPLFSSEREILSGWERATWCKGVWAPRRGSLWSVVKRPFLPSGHICGAPTCLAARSPGCLHGAGVWE